MQQKYCAKKILDELAKNDDAFIVNQDGKITEMIQGKMSSVDWEDLRKKNKIQDKRIVRLPGYDMWQYHNCMEQLNNNKNIAHMLPEKTRNRFLKRIINRVMRVSTQYQEIFNNNVVGAFGNLMEHLKSNETKMNEILDKLNCEFDNTINEKLLDAISDRISNNEKLLDTINDRISCNEKMLEAMIEQISNNKKLLEPINDRISNNEEEIEAINSKVNGDEKWIEAINNRLSSDEKWIEAVNARIQGSEKWLELLTRRVESDSKELPRLRSEIFAELKNFSNTSLKSRNVTDDSMIEPVILASFKDKVKRENNIIRLNLGSGLVVKEGYVNVDCREMDGVDIVSDVRNLSFRENEVDEILAAHLIEHFETEYLEKNLLPYWRSLLKTNGILRIIVPNVDVMINKYKGNEVSFDILRKVVFGGHEYADNYHYTMFNVEELLNLLRNAGFSEITVIEAERLNDICYEMEVVARK